MQLLQKSTYSQTQNTHADPVKHLEDSTAEYLHMSFLLWEYKQTYSKEEYRKLLESYSWDKGKTEEKKALKLAENFQDFACRPQDLFQIPVTTLLKLCSDKYKPIIEQLSSTEEDIDYAYVDSLIKSRTAQLKKEKELQLPQKPSIWKRNCRQERYVAFPPLYEDDQQTGVLTQKLMDEFGLIPQDILRRAIADLYQKIAEGEEDRSTAHDVDVVDNAPENNDNDYTQQEPNQGQAIEEKWEQFYRQIQIDIATHGEVSKRTGQLIFENCQQWEATVPADKKWSAIANICGYKERYLKHLSNYAQNNHSEWRASWGAMLASFDNFEQELEWVGINLRTDALIAMGYKIPAIVKVNDGSFQDRQGKIIELHGENDKPILVNFEDFQGYFNWNELEIVNEAETFKSYLSAEDIQEEEYLEEPEESDIEFEPTPLDKAIDALVNGDWKDIRDVFNEHPEVKEEAWNALDVTQKQRVINITPQIIAELNQAKKEGVIEEFKEFTAGMYRLKRPSTILWEPRIFNEFEVRHYLEVWRKEME